MAWPERAARAKFGRLRDGRGSRQRMNDDMLHSRAARRRSEDKAAAREKRLRETERQVVEEEARRKVETGRLRERDVARLAPGAPPAGEKPVSRWRRYGGYLLSFVR
jgi:hypothetical protein